jgi:hypothetical protein
VEGEDVSRSQEGLYNFRDFFYFFSMRRDWDCGLKVLCSPFFLGGEFSN